MQTPAGFTPADVVRRVTAMGVLVNPAIVWSYLRARYAERYPEQADALPPALLPVDEIDLEEWLDDFLDGVEAERSKLTRSMANDGSGAPGS